MRLDPSAPPLPLVFGLKKLVSLPPTQRHFSTELEVEALFRVGYRGGSTRFNPPRFTLCDSYAYPNN